jgi:hypothetical protein
MVDEFIEKVNEGLVLLSPDPLVTADRGSRLVGGHTEEDPDMDAYYVKLESAIEIPEEWDDEGVGHWPSLLWNEPPGPLQLTEGMQ